jgi:hypothetical protein
LNFEAIVKTTTISRHRSQTNVLAELKVIVLAQQSHRPGAARACHASVTPQASL